jgi:hypothetical protein
MLSTIRAFGLYEMVISAQSGWAVIGQRQVNSRQCRTTSSVVSAVSNVSSRPSARGSGPELGERLLRDSAQDSRVRWYR